VNFRPKGAQTVRSGFAHTPDGLIEELQIDQLDRPDTEPSIRLTIMPFRESPQAMKPSPFFKALSGKLGLDDVGD
jgi:hypothetical protein